MDMTVLTFRVRPRYTADPVPNTALVDNRPSPPCTGPIDRGTDVVLCAASPPTPAVPGHLSSLWNDGATAGCANASPGASVTRNPFRFRASIHVWMVPHRSA